MVNQTVKKHYLNHYYITYNLTSVSRLAISEIRLERLRRSVTLRMLALLLIIISNSSLYAQTKPLRIGDSVPDLVFKEILNNHIKELRLSNFKNKAIILDFWATWCASCVKTFPHLDSLQRIYPDHLQLLLLNISTRDSIAILKTFISTQKKVLPQFSVPIIKAEIALKKLFPFYALPHYVWISKSGKIVAITGAEELTKNNISHFLAGEELTLTIKTN